MMTTEQLSEQPARSEIPPEELPFVAPCRTLEPSAPLRWLRLGWNDLRRAPGPSISYGVVMVAVSYLISAVTLRWGDLGLYIGLLSGFVFLGPVLAIGLYSVSCQLQSGLVPQLGYCVREGRRHLGNELIFAFMLLIVFLIWARAASMLHIFFPAEAGYELADLALFLAIGTAVGAVFSAIVFMASAFSLPMIMDRKVDAVTAVVTSINAVLRNKLPMFIWAMIIVTAVLIGFATAFLALAVLLPVIGHATWHAYQDTIDASAWPAHDAPG